jgi:hypothetical protein
MFPIFLKDRENAVYIVNRLLARRFGGLIPAGAAYSSPKPEAESRAHTAS